MLGSGLRRIVTFALCSAIALTGACNALNGAGDLRTDACESCLEGTEGGADANDPRPDGGPGGDASPDGPNVDGPGGFVDPSFGTGGFVVSKLLDVVTAVAVRADGKIVVAGSSGGQLGVVRFSPDGSPDAAFGNGGLVVAGSGPASGANAVAIDPQGRIVAAGFAAPAIVFGNEVHAYVVRLTDTGALDSSFAQGGRSLFTTPGETIAAVAVGANGDLHLGGTVGGVAPGETKDARGAVWRLSTSGAQLGQTNIAVVYGPNRSASTITALSLGATNVAVAGQSDEERDGDFGIARVLLGGGFDTTFAGDGRATVAVGSALDRATAIGRLSDDSLVVGGEVEVEPVLGLAQRTPQLGLVRLLSNGTRDAAWGKSGTLLVPFGQASIFTAEAGDHLRGLVVDSRDRVLAVGYAREKGQGGLSEKVLGVVTRVRAGGVVDPLFAQNGLLLVSFGQPAAAAMATAVALQPDGKIVVAGTSAERLALARFTP